MRWPWVSRTSYAELDAQLRECERDRQEWKGVALVWKQEHQEQMALTADLLEKYHALKLQGAALPERPQYEEPVMPPDILMRAIREVSPTQDAAYLMNYQWAMGLKEHWADEPRMRLAAQQIRHGANYTPEPADV